MEFTNEHAISTVINYNNDADKKTYATDRSKITQAINFEAEKVIEEESVGIKLNWVCTVYYDGKTQINFGAYKRYKVGEKEKPPTDDQLKSLLLQSFENFSILYEELRRKHQWSEREQTFPTEILDELQKKLMDELVF
jgi:hypothetical protein